MFNDDSIQLSPILSMDCTKIANCTSKKRVLEIISELAAQQLHISSQIIFDALLTRERLGSTCIGNGVAIPHGKLEKDTQVVGVLIRLVQPIALDAVDHQPVDLIFALLAPLDQDKMHLKILSLWMNHMLETHYGVVYVLQKTIGSFMKSSLSQR